MNNTNKIVRSALGFAFVFGVVAYIPAIRIGVGFFNLSDAIIMILAFLYGPEVGIISAMGAAAGDFVLGYQSFIIFTLMTKCFTGYLIGKYRKILAHSQGNRIILTTIAMLYMIFTYIIHDWIVLKQPWMVNHIIGNLIQALVSIVLFDVFVRTIKGKIKTN